MIFNRGNSLKDRKLNDRKEMRDIQSALQKKDAAQIPDLFRSSARLWITKNNRGVGSRRKDEADWFQKGLECNCYE